MDLTKTVEPNSAQVNAEDFLSGPQTFTITGVEAGTSEQPVFIHLAELPDRTYRPSKSMRRVLVAAWGKEADAYVGRRLTLYRDPDVKFGGSAVGGIKISHMSHMSGPLKVALTVTRGKRALTTVAPLADLPPAPVVGALGPDVLATMSVDELRTHYTARQNAGATPDELAQIAALATETKEN